MKKITAFLCSAVLTVSLAAFPVSAENEASLLVLGDSIATGFRLKGYESGNNSSAKDSFANRLSADFSGYTNLAEDGKTSAQLLDDVKNDKDLRNAAQKADYTVISIGGNDFLQPMIKAFQSSNAFSSEQLREIMNGTLTVAEALEQSRKKAYESTIGTARKVDIEKSAENITEIIDTLISLNKDTDIYILTVYNPFEGVTSMGDIDKIAEELLAEMNKSISDAADKYSSVHAIDVHLAFTGHAAEYTNILTMDIHPSKKGHEVILKLLIRSFEKNPDFTHDEAAEPSEPAAPSIGIDKDAINKVISRITGKFGFILQ